MKSLILAEGKMLRAEVEEEGGAAEADGRPQGRAPESPRGQGHRRSGFKALQDVSPRPRP